MLWVTGSKWSTWCIVWGCVRVGLWDYIMSPCRSVLMTKTSLIKRSRVCFGQMNVDFHCLWGVEISVIIHTTSMTAKFVVCVVCGSDTSVTFHNSCRPSQPPLWLQRNERLLYYWDGKLSAKEKKCEIGSERKDFVFLHALWNTRIVAVPIFIFVIFLLDKVPWFR